jgi:RNA polymerase sigma-70 factor (ECF subfamily)
LPGGICEQSFGGRLPAKRLLSQVRAVGAQTGNEGRGVVIRFCASLFAAGRRFDLVPVRANGQPAFGAYLCAPDGIRHATAFYVLTLTGDQICAMTRFEASVLPWFGLPRSLPAR